MRLYSGPLSLFSKKVEIALAEKNLAFDRVEVRFTQTEGYQPKHPAVIAANPKGQVPVLEDGNLTLFDSTVILEYLEDAYPQPPLYPSEPRARALCRLVELDADEIIFADVKRILYRTEPPLADQQRQLARQADGRIADERIAGHYGRLEARLGEGQYFSDAFGAADIAMFMTIHYALRLNGPPLAPCPRLAAWYARVAARPSAARIVAEIADADARLSSPLSP